MHTFTAPFTPLNLEALAYPLHKHFPCFKHSSLKLVRENERAPSEVWGRAHGLHQTCLTSADWSLHKGCPHLLQLDLEMMPRRKQEQRKGEVGLSLPSLVWAQGPFFKTYLHGHCSLCQQKFSTACPQGLQSSTTWLVDTWEGILTLLLTRVS